MKKHYFSSLFALSLLFSASSLAFAKFNACVVIHNDTPEAMRVIVESQQMLPSSLGVVIDKQASTTRSIEVKSKDNFNMAASVYYPASASDKKCFKRETIVPKENEQLVVRIKKANGNCVIPELMHVRATCK